MGKYVEENEVLKQIIKCCKERCSTITAEDVYKTILTTIDCIPKVDIVHCNECQYWDRVNNPKYKGVGVCTPKDDALGGYCTRRGATKEYDYCSQGVRGTREEYIRQLGVR